MIKILQIIVLLAFSFAACADNLSKTWPQEVEASKKFKAALLSNDRLTVAGMIKYPLKRTNPLTPINSEKEFLASWDDYFDEKVITKISPMEPEDMGWRGIALGESGDVWFEKNKISQLNVTTMHYQQTLKEAVDADKATLHPAAREYESLEFVCDTADEHVRIHRDANNALVLFSWPQNSELSNAPKLSLKNGSLEFQGSGDNHSYKFTANIMKYEVQKTVLCGEDCNDYFVGYQNNKELYRKPCVERNR